MPPTQRTLARTLSVAAGMVTITLLPGVSAAQADDLLPVPVPTTLPAPIAEAVQPVVEALPVPVPVVGEPDDPEPNPEPTARPTAPKAPKAAGTRVVAASRPVTFAPSAATVTLGGSVSTPVTAPLTAGRGLALPDALLGTTPPAAPRVARPLPQPAPAPAAPVATAATGDADDAVPAVLTGVAILSLLAAAGAQVGARRFTM